MMDKLKTFFIANWKWLLAVVLFILVGVFVVQWQCAARSEREAAVLSGRAQVEAADAASHKTAADTATREYERAQAEEATARATADAAQKAAAEAADAAAIEKAKIEAAGSVDDLAEEKVKP